MSLLQRIQKDSQRIMNSTRFGVSIDIVLLDPAQVEYPLKSIVTVIHNLVDPDTGQPVSGYLATASINRLDLNALGIALPEGVSDELQRPWTVRETNIDGVVVTYKITRAAPDEANGNILCDLGSYGY
ncbi:hypothetical protein NVP1017O_10 [Vibrio phage 1.017.O._10N.286.55.C11]|nr:hypothetical protein NVP1017O_10 [Vibrio phage 1.017.O._10N.286.55.C11]AUR85442.1 hypothetical protein NVP1075O_10 [Vibrio phage 1.075.O._10N.286.55.B10]AUR86988.1 hypothetical protein NVP1093O_10 [Vibrio phage 1.093.O._10N.286.55.E10]AUR87061.1 hypothetical protein NVP1094O_10 [Vibrio phage 1.094.O._10N.286.55.E12]